MITFLEKTFGVKHTHPDFRFQSFLFSALLIISSGFAFFSYYNLVVAFYVPMLISNVIGLIFCMFGGYYLLVKKRPQIAAVILQTIVTVDSFILILIDGNEEFALAFAFLTPVLGIFLLGYRFGAALSAINFVCVVYFCFSQMDTWEPAPFLPVNLIHFSAIYFLILMVSVFYDSSRRKAYSMMEEANGQLQELATMDALTKIRNRRYLEDQLLSSKNNLFVAMIDVDDFKKVNDLFGHDKGDKVLIELAQQLKNNVGPNDIVGRWGGEEFVIIFSESDLTQLQKSLTKLNRNIAAHDFNVGRKITVSIGLSDHHASKHRDCLRQMDQALYEAKADGKNQFCIAISPT
ncbi:GGDEF domain-containing protein [Marinomonas primoryensis]|jgi:diguanylate cyclase (GGDEF)-like protein|uniref:GGDEF domain-containing protein n=1 Tax=Marinomonas primoryensis TaxID=178399 RepID=UPI0037043725